MDKWECTVCGYIYDPEKGDPDSNIPAGTPFEQLPENWTCPVCGAPKSQFVNRQNTANSQISSRF
jgi:rubredoxin